MNEKELTKEFTEQLNEEFAGDVPEIVVKAAQVYLAKRTPTELGMTLPNYIQFFKKRSNYNLHEIAIIVNNFSTTPLSVFTENSFFIHQYEEVAAGVSQLFLLWESQASPYRKSFNQKMELIKSKFR